VSPCRSWRPLAWRPAIGYALSCRSGSTRVRLGDAAEFIFGGLGFALAFGPINVAATAGVAPHEQGLAAGY